MVHLVLSSVMCHSHLCCAVFLHDQEWWLCNRHPYLVMLVCDVLGRGTKKKTNMDAACGSHLHQEATVHIMAKCYHCEACGFARQTCDEEMLVLAP